MSPRAPSNRLLLAVLLGALAMIGPFSIDTMFPAFPAIGADFGVGKLAMQQTLSLYLVAYAAMSLFHGPLSDAFGRRRVILTGVAVFALASIGCALARDMTQLLAFRVLQGLSAGTGLIVGRAVIRDCYERDDAQRLMSHVSMIFGIAPALAPIVGGWILGWAAWPAIFWFLAGWAVLLWLAIALGLPETHPPAHRMPVSPASIWHSTRAMLGNHLFLRLALAGSFNFGALFLYISSAPAFVLERLGLNEQQFGWFFVPTISGMMAGAWLSGRMAGRMSGTRLANLGFAICGSALVLNLAYNLAVSPPRIPLAVMPMTVLAFGIALVFPILTLAILDMYPRQRGAASSMQMFVGLVSHTIVAGAISPAVSHDALWLCLVSAVFTAAAWLLWRSYLRRCRVAPEASPNAPAYEPAGRL
ncbi:MAG TPA: multidrug effflux MFS transporter [Xanthomonadaceae bacterium]|nr:multidrug effflux MFS transporter [Xanthomonadaceae bacterium]